MTKDNQDTDTTMRCEVCGGRTGWGAEQCAKCHRWLCADCQCLWGDRAYCHDHQIHCVVCQRASDPEGHYCNACGDPVCDRSAYWCNDCDRPLCDECACSCDDCEENFCPDCMAEHVCGSQDPDYTGPYDGNTHVCEAFTFGVEIEIDGPHDYEPLRDSPLIAGWCPDCSLERGGMEYQTQPLTASETTLAELSELIRGIDLDADDNAGGHIHIARTDRQTPARWYWALHALDEEQAAALNMRHLNDSRWCGLWHNEYHGKDVAVNDDHNLTIELRTFGAWWKPTADMLAPAVRWAHVMWRFFQSRPVHTIREADIEAMSRVACANARPARANRVHELLGVR